MSTSRAVTFRAGRGEVLSTAVVPRIASPGPVVLLADISEFQPDIADAVYLNWSKAVIVRAMYGTEVDGAWYGGQRRNLLLLGGAQFLGCYQYLTASEDAAVQARAFAQLLGHLNPGEYPIADIEEGAGDQQARWQAWAGVIHSELGFAPGNYSGLNFAASAGLSPVDWVASYGGPEPGVPHKLWQFTDSYDVPGVGVADASLFHGSIGELRALAYGGEHPVPPKPAPPPQSAADAADFTVIATKVDALGVHLNAITSQLATTGGKLDTLATQLNTITSKLEQIMSEDASVLAVVTDETAQVTALGGSVAALQALVVALQAEVAAGGTALQPGTLAALQAAQASLDTLAATGAADVTTDTPVPPAPTA